MPGVGGPFRGRRRKIVRLRNRPRAGPGCAAGEETPDRLDASAHRAVHETDGVVSATDGHDFLAEDVAGIDGRREQLDRYAGGGEAQLERALNRGGASKLGKKTEVHIDRAVGFRGDACGDQLAIRDGDDDVRPQRGYRLNEVVGAAGVGLMDWHAEFFRDDLHRRGFYLAAPTFRAIGRGHDADDLTLLGAGTQEGHGSVGSSEED